MQNLIFPHFIIFYNCVHVFRHPTFGDIKRLISMDFVSQMYGTKYLIEFIDFITIECVVALSKAYLKFFRIQSVNTIRCIEVVS